MGLSGSLAIWWFARLNVGLIRVGQAGPVKQMMLQAITWSMVRPGCRSGL